MYYTISCFLVLLCASLYGHIQDDIHLIQDIAIALAIVTLLVCLFTPLTCLRTVDISQNRVTIRWNLMKRKKCIPLGLVDHFEKKEFIGIDVLSIFYKSGKIEKVPLKKKSQVHQFFTYHKIVSGKDIQQYKNNKAA